MYFFISIFLSLVLTWQDYKKDVYSIQSFYQKKCSIQVYFIYFSHFSIWLFVKNNIFASHNPSSYVIFNCTLLHTWLFLLLAPQINAILPLYHIHQKWLFIFSNRNTPEQSTYHSLSPQGANVYKIQDDLLMLQEIPAASSSTIATQRIWAPLALSSIVGSPTKSTYFEAGRALRLLIYSIIIISNFRQCLCVVR